MAERLNPESLGGALRDANPVLAIEHALEQLEEAKSRQLAEELRRQAELLAYRAARDYEEALRHIENTLVAAVDRDLRVSEMVRCIALDVVRTHMVRGLMRAQLEAGDRMTFWVRR